MGWWVAAYLAAAGLFYLWMYRSAKWDPSEEPVYRSPEELRSALPTIIARLPEHEQLVVRGRFYQGRSWDELAEQLQVRPAAVRSMSRRAIGNLRQSCALLETR